MNKSYTKIVLLAFVLVMVNVLADRFHARLDFTADKRYTLSSSTKSVLEELQSPVTIKVYVSEKVNAEFDNHTQEIKNMLEEYNSLSGGNVQYTFINPNKDEEIEKEAQQSGIAPLLVNSSERDKIEQVKAYKGLVFESGEENDVIPFLDPNSGMEYPLTSSIKKIAFTQKPKIAFLKSASSPKLSALQEAMPQLKINYEVQELSLSDTLPISEDLTALVLLNPMDSFSGTEMNKLENFYQKGGGIFIAYTNAQVNLGGGQSGPPMADLRSSQIESWLQRQGIGFEDKLVVDANSQSIMVQTGFFPQQIKFFYFPVITEFSNHLISKGLQALALQFVSPITYSGQADYTPLALSSDMSGTESLPVVFNLERKWSEADFTSKKIGIAGALADGDKKLVVMSNGEFIVNGEGEQAQKIQGDNIRFFINSIDWLAQNTQLIELRNKEVSFRPIKEIEEGEKSFLRYGNFLLPLLLILIYGLIRMRAKNSQRLRWQSDQW